MVQIRLTPHEVLSTGILGKWRPVQWSHLEDHEESLMFWPGYR